MKPISILFTSLESVNPVRADTRAGNNRRLSLIILPLLICGLFAVLLTACGDGSVKAAKDLLADINDDDNGDGGNDDDDGNGGNDDDDDNGGNDDDDNDDDNRLTQRCVYEAGETLDSCISFTYNDAKQVIQTDTRNDDGILISSATLNYYADGQPTLEVYYDTTDIASSIFNSDIIYNADNRQPDQVRVLIEYYTADGTLSEYGNSIYNAAGQLTRVDSYNSDGTLTEYYTYTYNAAGQLTREDSYYSNGTLDFYSDYSYNAAGQLTREDSYGSDGTRYGYIDGIFHSYVVGTYNYNTAGQRTREDSYSYDRNRTLTLREYFTYIYNAAGQLTRIDLYDSADAFCGSNVYTYGDESRRAPNLPANSSNDCSILDVFDILR